MTFAQVNALFENINKVKLHDYKFMASIHGAEMQDTDPEVQSSETVPLFGDATSYENMTDEEKEALTQKMLNKHRMWADNAL